MTFFLAGSTCKRAIAAVLMMLPCLAWAQLEYCSYNAPKDYAPLECKPASTTKWLQFQASSHSGNMGGTDLVDEGSPLEASQGVAMNRYLNEYRSMPSLCSGPTITWTSEPIYGLAGREPKGNVNQTFVVSYGLWGYDINGSGQWVCNGYANNGKLYGTRQLICGGPPGVWGGPVPNGEGIYTCYCYNGKCDALVEDCNTCSIGNPVTPGLGHKVQTDTDYEGAGAHPLTFVRGYNSRIRTATNEAGWRHNWARSLDVRFINYGGSAVTAVRDDGNMETYRKATDGTWSGYGGARGQLTVANGAGGKPESLRLHRFEDDSTELYNGAGKLLSVTQRNGWATTLEYSTPTTPVADYLNAGALPQPSLLIVVRNHFGRQLRLAYDVTAQSVQLTQLIPPGALKDGTTGTAQAPIRYGYDTAGNLSSITWQDGATRRYHYENPTWTHHLTGITDELGNRVSSYDYDANGRTVLSQRGAEKYQFSYSGTPASDLWAMNTITAPDGSATVYNFEVKNGVVRPTSVGPRYGGAPYASDSSTHKASSYDTAGRLTRSVEHDGSVNFYSYDAKGRETERATFPASYQTATTRPALNLAIKVLSTKWHATWNLPVQIAEPGKFSAYSYSSTGNLSGQSEVTTTDATGAKTFSAIRAGAVVATGWSYSRASLPTTIVQRIDATETGRWTLAYNALGDVTRIADVKASRTATISSYDAHGRMLAGTNDVGANIRLSYSTRGFISSQSVNNEAVSFTQNPVGLTTDVHTPDGQNLRYVYDLNHRLTDVQLNGVSITGAMLARGDYPIGFTKVQLARFKQLLEHAQDLIPSAFAQVGLPWRFPVPVIPGQPMPGQPEYDPRTDMMSVRPVLPSDRAALRIAETFARQCECKPDGGYTRPTFTMVTYAHVLFSGHLSQRFAQKSYFAPTEKVGQALVDEVMAKGKEDPREQKPSSRATVVADLKRVVGYTRGPNNTFVPTTIATIVYERDNCNTKFRAGKEVVTMFPGYPVVQ